MQLQYPSEKEVKISSQQDYKTKFISKLAYSIKEVPTDSLEPALKQKITSFIRKDNHKKLMKSMKKNVINGLTEIGAPGCNWTVLHFCAQFNAKNCTRAILHQQFSISEQKFKETMNKQTIQGYTSLMISVIYKSEEVLSLLLQLGGVNLNLVEKGKLNASDLALQYRNQKATELINMYENKSKKLPYINYDQLSKAEQQIQDQPKNGFCYGFYSYILSCFHFGQKQDYDQNDLKSKQIGGFKIQWQKISSIQGQNLQLFSGFKPHDIVQKQCVLRNNLIIAQSLSDYPWLLRKIIQKKDITNPNSPIIKYLVTLYKEHQIRVIQIDQSIPVLRLNGQPMFLSNQNQCWPMILQKSLAKINGSYFSLNQINPTKILESITGFYTTTLSFEHIKSISDLQVLAMRGNLVLLQGKIADYIQQSNQHLFSILTFYEKGDDKKVLVGCPKILKNWQQQSKNVQLTIMKSHYNRPNQSCIWIDQAKLHQYFSSIVVSFIRQDYLRKDYKINIEEHNSTYTIFFKFKLTENHEDPIYLQIVQTSTNHRFDLQNIMCLHEDNKNIVEIQFQHKHIKQIIRLQAEKGQYLCRFQIQDLVAPVVYNEIKKNKKNETIIKSGGGILKSKNDFKSKQAIDQNKPKQAENRSRNFQYSVKQHTSGRNNEGKKGSHEFKSKKILQVFSKQNSYIQQPKIQLVLWSSSQIGVTIIQQEKGLEQWFTRMKQYWVNNWNKLNEKGFCYQIISNRALIVAVPTKKQPSLSIQFSQDRCKGGNVLQGKWIATGGGYIQMLKDTNLNCFYCILKGIQKSDCASAIILQQ